MPLGRHRDRYLPPARAFLLGLAALFGGCNIFFAEEAPPVADSTLVEVFVDLHLADARAETYDDVSPVLRDSVLAHHGVDSTAFKAALEYYSRHPGPYSDLYGEVLNRLTQERQPLSRF